jgi:hypothetical protein
MKSMRKGEGKDVEGCIRDNPVLSLREAPPRHHLPACCRSTWTFIPRPLRDFSGEMGCQLIGKYLCRHNRTRTLAQPKMQVLNDDDLLDRQRIKQHWTDDEIATVMRKRERSYLHAL